MFQTALKFSYNCNFFFKSVYRVEISTRDENLHIITPLDTRFFRLHTRQQQNIMQQ